MGLVVESCRGSVNCCDKKDEDNSFVKYQTDNSDEESDNNEEENSENTDSNANAAPQDIENIKIKANELVMERTMSPWEFYEELDDLGSGTYGVVKKVRLIKSPDIIRAMKMIPKENIDSNVDASNLLDEIQILKQIEHPNIMKVYECFVDDNYFYIISDLCDQGHLLGKLEKLGKMDPIVVNLIMYQVLNAVAYLHSKNILHGDIKLENVLLYTATSRAGRRFTSLNEDLNSNESLREDLNKNYRKSKIKNKTKKVLDDMLNYEVKLIDFGCSKYFVKKNKHKKLRGIIGTSIYCSPEVVRDLYDEKCDEWSCGVLMYILLCGQPPFSGETEEEIFDKIKKCDYNFAPKEFNYVSDNCKNLIKRLLEPNKKKRITAMEALKHPFFTENFNSNMAMTEHKDLTLLLQLIDMKKPVTKFHEAIIAYLCSNFIASDEERKLRELFRYMDKDGSNALEKEEFQNCFNQINQIVSPEELDNIINDIDSNGTSKVEYEEFKAALCDKKKLLCEANLKNAFNFISNNEGNITSKHIRNFLFHDTKVSDKSFNDFLSQFGMKEDDTISYEQFAKMMQNNVMLNESENKDGEDKFGKKVSKYAFKGEAITEEVAEDEEEKKEMK